MNLRKRALLSRLMAPADDGTGGGGGGTPPQITPEVQALIDAAVAQQVAGLKAKNSELLASNKDIKTKFDALNGQLEGLDMDAVKGLLQKVGQDEETKLIAEGKIDDVFARRTERLQAEHAKQIKAANDRADAAERSSAAVRERALADAVRSAATKAGALPEAADDFVYRSRGQFAFNDVGEVIAVDRDGQAILGKDGKTALSPSEWAESLKETAPHLWPRAAGAGAPGNTGGKATKPFNEMTEAEHVALYRKNPDEFARLQAAATAKKE